LRHVCGTLEEAPMLEEPKFERSLDGLLLVREPRERGIITWRVALDARTGEFLREALDPDGERIEMTRDQMRERWGPLVASRAMDEQGNDERRHMPKPTVTLVEIAELLSVSKQRAHKLADEDGSGRTRGTEPAMGSARGQGVAKKWRREKP
jgi:hypothetical protein